MEDMAKSKQQNAAALAVVDDDAAALAALDDFDFGVDGMEEVGAEDIKIASRVWNVKGKDANGDPMPPNVFYDTLHETTTKRLNCVLLVLHKERRWSYFDNDKQETVHVCTSRDRKEGELLVDRGGIGSAGKIRSCEGCPQAKWATNDKGKREQLCADVYGVVGLDLETRDPFIIRFKKTGLGPLKTHLQKHHIGARHVGHERRNVPLFAYSVTLELEMSSNGNYSIPVFHRGPVFDRDQLQAFAQQAQDAREIVVDAMLATEKRESGLEGGDESGDGAGLSNSDFTD